MKTVSKLISIFVILILSQSCIIGNGVNGNGNVIKKKLEISSNFTAIKVSQGIDIFLTQAPNFKIEAEMDENFYELLETIVENNTLKVSFKKNIGKRTKTAMYISMPEIIKLKTSSGAEINSVNQLKLNNIKLEASSGSEIELNIVAKDINAEVSSGSDIELKGTTDKLTAEASSGSDIDAEDLIAKNVIANASSGADINVHATESLKAEASSGADIDCKGQPKSKDISKSSGGDVDVK